MVELKDTLLMPNTKFPMRGNLPNKEPEFLKRWEEMDLYNKILEKNAGKPSYVLHDGPPYANGNIHIGHALNKILKEYLYFGGIPKVVLANTEEDKIALLKNFFELTYIKDIVERKKIENEAELIKLTKTLASNTGSLTNPQKLSNTFLSLSKTKISVYLIEKYIDALIDAFLLKKAIRYSIKGKAYISAPFKYYFQDLGIRNSILDFRQFEPTHLMENLIYNELISRDYLVDVGVVEKNVLNENGNGTRVKLEVDFVANKGNKRLYIQSCYSIEDLEKQKIEERPFREIDDNFEKILVVMNLPIRSYQTENGIKIISLLDFLLN